MFDFTALFDFSRNHCVAICAFFVPLNLLATARTLFLLFSARPSLQLRLAATFASLCALTLFLHVGTWFMIGVVMAPTFILSGLGMTCLAINLAAIIQTEKFQQLRYIQPNRLFHGSYDRSN